MHIVATGSSAVAGAVIGIPMAAIAFATPAHGALRMQARWWRGEPARPAAVGAISLLTGTAAGLVTVCLPLSPALPAFWIFAALAIALAIIDLRLHRLPHALTGTIAGTSIGCFSMSAALSGEPEPLLGAIATGSVFAMSLLLIALAFPGQLGLGDVALAGVVALNLGWLSWRAAATGILGAFLVQGVIALFIRARVGDGRVIPLGPALVSGWLVSLLLEGYASL